MWRYEVFARKTSWYFIGVYITIIKISLYFGCIPWTIILHINVAKIDNFFFMVIVSMHDCYKLDVSYSRLHVKLFSVSLWQIYHCYNKCKELGAIALVHAENGSLIAEVWKRWCFNPFIPRVIRCHGRLRVLGFYGQTHKLSPFVGKPFIFNFAQFVILSNLPILDLALLGAKELKLLLNEILWTSSETTRVIQSSLRTMWAWWWKNLVSNPLTTAVWLKSKPMC